MRLQKGDARAARAAFGESVAALKPLVAIDEANIPAKTELAGALIKLAGVSDDAEARYKQALDILEPLEVSGKLSERAGRLDRDGQGPAHRAWRQLALIALP